MVIVTGMHELVDPARCRIWSGHNRDYAALNQRACADLIESLRAQGRQEVPAIVRRVTGDPDHAFEVVCGARRHWSVTWLRAHGDAGFRFLVEPREMSDEEAFRVADLENRSRKDLRTTNAPPTMPGRSRPTMPAASSAWPNGCK